MKDFSRTNKRWVTSLNEIKEYFNNNNTRTCQLAFRDRGLHCGWTTFLLDNKVIFKNEYGYYKWKEDISVTKRLIEKYRVYRDSNKTTIQTTLPFKDKPKIGCKLTPYIDKNAPDYIKDYPIEMEICQPGQKPVKHKVQRTWTPIVETPKQQIGLIRKLWRWIY
jgi:hypothetical protein